MDKNLHISEFLTTFAAESHDIPLIQHFTLIILKILETMQSLQKNSDGGRPSFSVSDEINYETAGHEQNSSGRVQSPCKNFQQHSATKALRITTQEVRKRVSFCLRHAIP